MKLIVGLGNPGKKYEKTRHNMGFISIDLFAEKAKLDFDKEGFNGEYAKGKIFDDDVILLKPSTFMNLSGESVFSLASYFKISIEFLDATILWIFFNISIFSLVWFPTITSSTCT